MTFYVSSHISWHFTLSNSPRTNESEYNFIDVYKLPVKDSYQMSYLQKKLNRANLSSSKQENEIGINQFFLFLRCSQNRRVSFGNFSTRWCLRDSKISFRDKSCLTSPTLNIFLIPCENPESTRKRKQPKM